MIRQGSPSKESLSTAVVWRRKNEGLFLLIGKSGRKTLASSELQVV